MRWSSGSTHSCSRRRKPRSPSARRFEWTPSADSSRSTPALPSAELHVGRGATRLLRAGGRGPGEFRRLRAAYRVDSETLHAIDSDGRLTAWTPDGELLGDWQLDVRNVLSAGAASDSTLVVVTGPSFASATEYDAEVVRLVDRRTRTEIESGVSLPIRPDNLMAVATLEGTGPVSPGARTLMTWPIFDTLWVADVTGRSIGSVLAVPIGSETLAANGPPVDRRQDPDGFNEWVANSSLVGEAFQAPDGGWLVEVLRIGQTDSGRGLVRLRPDGTRVWEVEGAPSLALVDTAGVLYFRDPSGVRPNVFLRARLR